MLIAGAFFVCLYSAVDAQAQAASASCEQAAELAVLPSPVAPWKGAPLRVIVAAEKPLEGELSLVAPDGSVAAKSRERHGGPPYFWFAEVASPAAGTWHAKLARDGAPAECGEITHEIAVRPTEPPRPRATDGSLWPIRNTWDRATENLYSAWIEKLFDAPLDAAPSWPALHEVLRDRSRNVLFNHLGLREDQMGLIIRPDCADLPYFLRAYFAFKMGLPFGYAKCTRGGAGEGPKCYEWWNIQHLEEARPAPPSPPEQIAAPRPLLDVFGRSIAQPAAAIAAKPPAPAPKLLSLAAAKQMGLAPAFGQYLRQTVADGVHSGSGRTAASDDNTDYYPVPLNEETLRPGTVYADPYGHLLVLVRRVPQSGGAAGVFLAVDGQPDGTVARKRFWRGNFLFAQDPALGGPGFKRFRPIVREKNGAMRRLTNAEIAKNPEYGDYSLDQARLGIEDFYDRMDDVMSPAPLDPVRAIKEVITSLDEQVKTRVTSVENGRKFQSQRARRGGDAGRRVDLRDDRRVGRLRDAVARPAPVDRDRRGAHLSGSRRAPARALRDAGGQERRGCEGRAGGRARGRACGAQVLVYPQRRLRLDARAQGRDRPHAGARDGVQRERLRRAAVGRAGEERRGCNVQAAGVVGTAREDDGLPHLVPRAAPPTARLAVGASCRDATAFGTNDSEREF